MIAWKELSVIPHKHMKISDSSDGFLGWAGHGPLRDNSLPLAPCGRSKRHVCWKLEAGCEAVRVINPQIHKPSSLASLTKPDCLPPQLGATHNPSLTLPDSYRGMDGQIKMSSPTFSNNPSDAARSSHFTPIRPDHVGSLDQLSANDGYDSNRSPTGSATMGDSGGAKRRKVNHGKRNSGHRCIIANTGHAACLYCRRSHMTCDSNRPCARCVKRNIGHLCHDEVKDKSRENGSDSTSQSPAVDVTSPDQLIEGEIKTGRLPEAKRSVLTFRGRRSSSNWPESSIASSPTTVFQRLFRLFEFVLAVIPLLTGAVYLCLRCHWK